MKYIKRVMTILFGIIAFSTISRYIIENIFGFNFFIIEIFFIPLLLIFPNKIISTIFRAFRYRFKYFLFLFLLFFIGIFLGIILTGELISVLTLARSPFYLLLLIMYFSESDYIKVETLYLLSLGSVLGEMLFILYLATIADYYQGVYGIVPINLVALGLLVLIPIISRKFYVSVFSISIAYIVSIISGFRINLIVIVFALFIGFLWNIITSRLRFNIAELIKKVFRLSVLIIFLSIVIIFLESINTAVFSFFNANFITIERVTNRFYSFLKFDFVQSRDVGRISKYSLIFEQFFNKIIPYGPIGRTEYGNIGDNMDVPLTFLYDIFGSIATVYILFLYLKRVYFNIISILKSCEKSITIILPSLFSFIFMILLIINGRFLYIIYEVILTGILIGQLFNNRSVSRYEI